MNLQTHINNLNNIFKNVYIAYFLLFCSLTNIFSYFNGKSFFLLFLCSIYVTYASGKTLYSYHIKKTIDLSGKKLHE